MIARFLLITGAGLPTTIDRGEKDEYLLRSLVLNYVNKGENLLLWRAYFPKLHVVVTETGKGKNKGKGKSRGKGGENRDGPRFTVVYKWLIRTRSGHRTYIALELREDSPEIVEAKSGIPLANRARWEKNWVPLDRIRHYMDKMKGKLSQQLQTAGTQVFETSDSTTAAGQEMPELPQEETSTYKLKWRWAANAVSPGAEATAGEGGAVDSAGGAAAAMTDGADGAPQVEGSQAEPDIRVQGGGAGAFISGARRAKRARPSEN